MPGWGLQKKAVKTNWTKIKIFWNIWILIRSGIFPNILSELAVMSTLVPVMVMPNAWMRVTKKTSQDRVDSLTSSLKSSLACPKLNKWPSRLQIMMCKYWHKKFSKEEIYVSDKFKKDYTIKVCLKHDFFVLEKINHLGKKHKTFIFPTITRLI